MPITVRSLLLGRANQQSSAAELLSDDHQPTAYQCRQCSSITEV